MIDRPLGLGQFPDACWHAGRWWTAWQHGTSLFVVSLEPGTLREVSFTSIELGPRAGAFAKLRSWLGRLWLAYRDGEPHERLWLRELGTSTQHDLGRAHGNDPAVFGAGVIAWQSTGQPDYQVVSRSLDAAPRTIVPRKGSPTGLSRISPDGTVQLVDDDREVVAGFTRPAWAGDLVTVEYHRGGNRGVLARLTDDRERLLWSEVESFTPRCATDGGDRFLAVTWGGSGVRAIEIARDEFQAPQALDPVIDRESVIDVVDYLPIGLALDGDHLFAFRYNGQQPNVFSLAKHPDGGGEWWAHDDQWVYHHLDQSSSPIEEVISGRFTPRFATDGSRIDAYFFADDARWMPRRVRHGDSLTVSTQICRIADGHRDPWRHINSFEIYSAWPTVAHGLLPALRMRYDPRTARDPNGRLKGGYEWGTYARSADKSRWELTWEAWRTKDDNSGDERVLIDGQPLIRRFSALVNTAVTWRPSRRPANTPLLPAEDDMQKPGVTIDHFDPVIRPGESWRVEFHDRNNPGHSGVVEIINGSVHVRLTNPVDSDRSGLRRPVEVRCA